MSLVINVRFNSTHAIAIDAETNWTVQKLKEVIGQRNNIASDQLVLIFQGRALPNNIQLQACGLCSHTYLHAVQVQHTPSTQHADNTRRLADNAVNTRHLTDAAGLNDISHIDAQPELHTFIAGSFRSQFYVFCKSPCQGVTRGKLRVRCRRCQQGTLTLHREPCDWDDVLLSGRISGQCQAQGCDGDIAEFFFKCSQHETAETDTAVPLDLVKANMRLVPCLACLDIVNPVLVFTCNHVICLECFRVYCTTKLNERGFFHDPDLGYTLGCPVRCVNSLIKEVHHFRVVGADQYERYQRFGAEECLLQNGGVLCPAPGCGAGIVPDISARRVECIRQSSQGCGLVFCRFCLDAFHDGPCRRVAVDEVTSQSGNSYEVDPESALRAQWERASSETIEKTTKSCPQCRVPTERSGGCSHMTCVRCMFEWCWLCHVAWNRDCQGDHWFD